MNGQDMDILVRAVDSHGHRFHNFSSLVVSWTSTDHGLASFYLPQTAYSDEDGKLPGSRLLTGMIGDILFLGRGLFDSWAIFTNP